MQLLRSALGVVAGLIILSLVNPLSAVLTVLLVAIFAIDPATIRDIEAGCTIIIFGIGAYAAYRAYKKIAGVRKAG